MGIALAFLVGVVAAEEMPRNSRAYAVSILAMAAGSRRRGRRDGTPPRRPRPERLATRLSSSAPSGVSSRSISPGDSRRRDGSPLPTSRDPARATQRTRHSAPRTARSPRINRRRLLLLSVVAFAGNVFIAPASFFQNRYLTDVQGFSGGMIGFFSIAVGTPAEHRAHRRWSHRRHERSTSADRGHRAARHRGHRRRVHGQRRPALDAVARRRPAVRARPILRWRCTGSSCSPPATAAGRRASSRPPR